MEQICWINTNILLVHMYNQCWGVFEIHVFEILYLKYIYILYFVFEIHLRKCILYCIWNTFEMYFGLWNTKYFSKYISIEDFLATEVCIEIFYLSDFNISWIRTTNQVYMLMVIYIHMHFSNRSDIIVVT